jgi:hypothetical protein
MAMYLAHPGLESESPARKEAAVGGRVVAVYGDLTAGRVPEQCGGA